VEIGTKRPFEDIEEEMLTLNVTLTQIWP